MIAGNPYIKTEDKPKRREEIMRLGIDEEVKKTKVRKQKVTVEDIRIFEQLKYNGTDK